MTRFLYFIPEFETGALTTEHVKKIGLGYTLEDDGPMGQKGHAVNGVTGVVFAHGGESITPDAKSVTWENIEEITGDERHRGCYIGVPNPLPRATDLARTRILPGRDVILNGEPWHIPKAFVFSEENELPSNALPGVLKWRSGQSVIEIVNPIYKRLTEIAQQYWYGEEKDKVTFPFSDAVLAITANYRASLTEITIMSNLTSEKSIDIYKIILDVQGFSDLKKNLETEPELKDG